jgi:hypothetical protein
MQLPALARKPQLPCKVPRPLRTVRRTAIVRYFNARGIGRNVDTYA